MRSITFFTVLLACAVSLAAPPKKAPPKGKPAEAKPAANEPLLKIDCTASGAFLKEKTCNRISSLPSGSVGKGPTIKSLPGMSRNAYGATIDGNTVYVGVGWKDYKGVIFGFDLTTGDRRIVSGEYEDPAEGTMTVGKGPAFNYVSDVQKGPDGKLYALSWSTGPDPRTVFRVDPATGDREQVWQTSKSATGPEYCSMNFEGKTSAYNPHPVPFSLAVMDDGIYLGIQEVPGGTGMGVIRLGLDGKSCAPVSVWKALDPKFNRGKGPEYLDWFNSLRAADGMIYAVHPTGRAIVRFDPATGDRRRITSVINPVLGGGATDIGRYWLAWDPEKKLLWTSGVLAGGGTKLVSVDPATGDRNEPEWKGPAPAGTLGAIWKHPTKPLLVGVSDGEGLVLIDPATGNSNVLSY